MGRLAKVLTKVNKLLGFVSGGLILIVNFLLFVEVILRYFFHSPTAWSADVSRYLLLVIVFFAVALTLQEDGHIKVEFVTDRIRNSLKSLVGAIAHLISLGYCGVLLWKVSELFIRANALNLKTNGDYRIPTSWLYAVMILGFALMIIVLLVKIYEIIFQRNKEN